MAHLDGTLKTFLLLDAFLKSKIKECSWKEIRRRGRGEDKIQRRDGRRGDQREDRLGVVRSGVVSGTWNKKCKVFIGGLKSSMARHHLEVGTPSWLNILQSYPLIGL